VEGVRNITRQAILRGHDPEIVTLDNPGSHWHASWTPEVHVLGNAHSISGMYGYAPKLDRWLEKNLRSFDRVVVHGIWMYFSYSVWKAARGAGVPYYLFIHGALDPWFRNHYPLKHLKKFAYWKLIEHRVLRDAAAVLFTTQEEMIRARNAFSPYRCKPTVIGYGIAPIAGDRLSHREAYLTDFTATYPLLRKRRYVLVLARIHEKKGIDLVLRAFAASQKALKGLALVVAGAGDSKYLASLKGLASSLGIEEDVIWTGPLYAEAKINTLRAADVYVLPSHQENFGISVVEALACGTPVLISDKVNIWREVLAGDAGFVEPDDEAGTTRLLMRWAGLPPDAMLLMRRRAEECFNRSFNITVTCERLFDVVLNDLKAGSEAPAPV
jgi:glycosyltransferase involved in cell wall biosynthesis